MKNMKNINGGQSGKLYITAYSFNTIIECSYTIGLQFRVICC